VFEDFVFGVEDALRCELGGVEYRTRGFVGRFEADEVEHHCFGGELDRLWCGLIDALGDLSVDVHPGPPCLPVLERPGDLRAELGVVGCETSAGRRGRFDASDGGLDFGKLVVGERVAPLGVQVADPAGFG